jgi:hypothetical protein
MYVIHIELVNSIDIPKQNLTILYLLSCILNEDMQYLHSIRRVILNISIQYNYTILNQSIQLVLYHTE